MSPTWAKQTCLKLLIMSQHSCLMVYHNGMEIELRRRWLNKSHLHKWFYGWQKQKHCGTTRFTRLSHQDYHRRGALRTAKPKTHPASHCHFLLRLNKIEKNCCYNEKQSRKIDIQDSRTEAWIFKPLRYLEIRPFLYLKRWKPNKWLRIPSHSCGEFLS